MEPMPAPRLDPVDYYRRVAPVLLAHLADRPVAGLPAEAPDPAHARPLGTRPASSDDLAALVAGGVVGFVTTSDERIVLHLTPGAGADIATAATAALHLAEQCAADGLPAVALTDGAEGLYVLAPRDAAPDRAAALYAAVLTSHAPELATQDPTQADGRCLLQVQPHAVPVPYTLLYSPDGGTATGAAIPLHLDEVAAITAGMPAELTAADVPDRLATRGDLAAPLLGPATG